MDQRELTKGVKQYYDNAQDDRNLLLGEETGIVNHHYGIGDFDENVLQSTDETTRMIHELEINEINALMDIMIPVRKEHVVLDAGSGRGGTSFMIHERFGATVHGATISPYQFSFASNLVKKKGLTEKVIFHEMDYLNLSFNDDFFDHIVTNETTQYTFELEKLFAGFYRVLKKGGRYSIVTWCKSNGVEDSESINKINKNYGTTMHQLDEYLNALKKVGFKRILKVDFTELAIPYWEIRKKWAHASGIEESFLKGFADQEIRYYIITATK